MLIAPGRDWVELDSGFPPEWAGMDFCSLLPFLSSAPQWPRIGLSRTSLPLNLGYGRFAREDRRSRAGVR